MSITSPLVNWAGNVDADPSGSLTIPAGSNRLLMVVVQQQFNEDFFGDVNPSLTVGGQSPTYTYDHAMDPKEDVRLTLWVWDEAAIATMSGTTAAYSDSQNVQTRLWSYAVRGDVNQTTPVKFTKVVKNAAGPTHLVDGLVSASGDYEICFVCHAVTGSREHTTATPGWSLVYEEPANGNNAEFALFENASGGSTQIQVDQELNDNRNTLLFAVIVDEATTGPFITSVNGGADIFPYQTEVSILGGNLQDIDSVEIDNGIVTAVQTDVVATAGEVTFTCFPGNLQYGANLTLTIKDGGVAQDTETVVLTPFANRDYVDVSGLPNPQGHSILDICSPAAADGDQIEYWEVTAEGFYNIVVAGNGSFIIDTQGDPLPQSFEARWWDATTSDWSNWETFETQDVGGVDTELNAPAQGATASFTVVLGQFAEFDAESRVSSGGFIGSGSTIIPFSVVAEASSAAFSVVVVGEHITSFTGAAQSASAGFDTDAPVVPEPGEYSALLESAISDKPIVLRSRMGTGNTVLDSPLLDE